MAAMLAALWVAVSLLLPGGALALERSSAGSGGPRPAAHLPQVEPAAEAAAEACLYPSPNERFGLTTGHPIDRYDVGRLAAGAYHNWAADRSPAHPNDMHYRPLIRLSAEGYSPSGRALARAVAGNPGATWLIGNEADTIWQDNLPPEAYAQRYHDVVTAIQALDPSARFAANGLATVSALRLEWLERAWQAYRRLYGNDMPVDVWNVHTYLVNEMVHEWGPSIPPGLENAVGYGVGRWAAASVSGASGGSVHESRTPGARAYFAFTGDAATFTLATGPDAGIADIYRDGVRVESVDLYSRQPGLLTRSYSSLPVHPDARLGHMHHLAAFVTGRKNPAASDVWVRVDALSAASTASLPAGKLENDSPLQARIVMTVDDYDNLDLISDQIRLFRQWMASHGQRHKPLINSEYGILLGEEQGYDYQRVRRFMLGSLDLFANGLVDEALGYPEDGNRMLQEWYWYVVAQETFNGARVHTGLFDQHSAAILPLGLDYASAVTSATQYTDLAVTAFTATPTWTLFAGEPSQVILRARVHNRGTLPADPFQVRLAEGGQIVEEWAVPGLSPRYGDDDSFELQYEWRPVVTADRTLTLTADSAGQVDEPCDPNNTASVTVTLQAFTDLTVANPRMTPRYLAPLPAGQSAAMTFQVDVLNLGSLGAAADRVVVNLWERTAGQDETLLDSQSLARGAAAPAMIALTWPQARPGLHHLLIEVQPVAEESNLANNAIPVEVLVPTHAQFIPALR